MGRVESTWLSWCLNHSQRCETVGISETDIHVYIIYIYIHIVCGNRPKTLSQLIYFIYWNLHLVQARYIQELHELEKLFFWCNFRVGSWPSFIRLFCLAKKTTKLEGKIRHQFYLDTHPQTTSLHLTKIKNPKTKSPLFRGHSI